VFDVFIEAMRWEKFDEIIAPLLAEVLVNTVGRGVFDVFIEAMRWPKFDFFTMGALTMIIAEMPENVLMEFMRWFEFDDKDLTTAKRAEVI
jgi:hypothetical protein